MLTKRHRLLWILSIIVTLGTGLLIGYLVKNWFLLQLDPKIGIADVIGILLSLITLGIGYYIASNLERNKKKEEYQFDFILKKLDDFRKRSLDLSNTVYKNDCKVPLISSKLKGLSLEYEDFSGSLDFCGMQINEEENKELKSLVLTLKKLCTDNRRMHPGENIIAYTDSLELKTENGIFSYSEIRVDQIQNQVRFLNNKLFEYTINSK